MIAIGSGTSTDVLVGLCMFKIISLFVDTSCTVGWMANDVSCSFDILVMVA